MIWKFLILLMVTAPAAVAGGGPATTRAQVDSVGFAITTEDFAAALGASLAAEGLAANYAATSVPAAVAVILPHDDYLYAGRTAVHALPYLQAKRWIVFGVCHACRRVGVRDHLLLDDDDQWQVAGQLYTVDTSLRAELLGKLGDLAVTSPERHHAEHSIEALLPWIGTAVPDAVFVPILVPGMELDRLEDLAVALAGVLAAICRDRGWQPGLDLGLLISADAVHYGCEGWGSGGYAPFGCDEEGHAKGRAQDVAIAQGDLSGQVTAEKIAAFTDTIWDRDCPDYPANPYKITWCGLYSIPFGLTTALRLQELLEAGPLTGHLLRYGDSVTDGRLTVKAAHLGVTAPNTLQHWVGYPTIVYR